MTPIKQGMYEFNKESLIEIRKRMGISQSKMAELLGVPPNTLSRWETGATVPDASSLAAIYSLVKEHGIDPPPFFVIRTNPLELKISSKSSDHPVDSLSFYQLLRSYLNTQIELIGTEVAPVIKVEIHNTAPVTPDWPKIVFTGVGLSLAHTGRDTQAFLPSRLKTRISRKSEEKSNEIAESPWQHDSKREDLLKITYGRIDHKEFPDITSDEGQHGEVLFPGQSVVYEIDVTTDLLPYIQFKVEGTVSRRHLFHCQETFIMPENITKPLVISALVDFNAIDLYEPLESVINLMPKFDSNTRLAEVQTFSIALSTVITKIKATQENLSKVFRQHKFFWFQAHLRAAFIYLDRVSAALTRVKGAIESNIPDKIAAEASAILALKSETAQLDRETQELMRMYNISDEEVKRSKVEELKAAVETAAQFKAESPVPVVQKISDELDLHGKMVEEVIPLVDSFLEDSYNANKRRVWIVHGKGTGVLRQAVGEHLSKHRLVKSYALADGNRGGDGATQVDIVD